MQKNSKSGNVLVLALVGVAGVLLLAGSLLALRSPTQFTGQAVTPGGAGRVTITPATNTVFPGATFTSTVKFNTGGQPISGLTLRITYPCGTNCTTPNLDVVNSSGTQTNTVTVDPGILADAKWQIPVKTVTRANNLVTIDIAAVYNDVTGYSTAADVNLASFILEANSAVTSNLTFDTTRSVMLTKAEPVTDILGTATGATYTVQNDATAPVAVSNLASPSQTTTSVSLSWTAPTDTGPLGRASSYDLRYSTSAITAANFGSATAATGLAAPKAAGQAETFTVSGLTPNTPYFFAIKSADAAGNVSAISNVVSASTANPNSTLTVGYKLQGVNLGPIPAGYNTGATVILKNGATVMGTYPITVSSNTSGVYTPTALIQLGTLPITSTGTSYDVFVKDPTHLQKKLGTLVFNFGANNTQPTLGTPTLKSGDFDNSNVLNAPDVGAILNQYTALEVPVTASNRIYDVDQNGLIQLFDLGYVLANFTQINVPGDN